MEKLAKPGEVKCNKKVREALIESGACDRWGMRDEISGQEIMKLEQNLLGISLTMGGEVQQHRDLLRRHVYEAEEFEAMEDGEEVIAGGDVVDINTTTTKKGEQMAFVYIARLGVNQWRCVFFPQQWKAYQRLIEEGRSLSLARRTLGRAPCR